jgi:hypothetical protein
MGQVFRYRLTLFPESRGDPCLLEPRSMIECVRSIPWLSICVTSRCIPLNPRNATRVLETVEWFRIVPPGYSEPLLLAVPLS